jgi:hypothetical protein
MQNRGTGKTPISEVEQERQKTERLTAQLRALGIDPDV